MGRLVTAYKYLRIHAGSLSISSTGSLYFLSQRKDGCNYGSYYETRHAERGD